MVCAQVSPKSDEVQMGPSKVAATTLDPSAEEAAQDHRSAAAALWFQMAPAFVEVKIGPPSTTATSLVPSEEEATEVQFVIGALVGPQLCACALEAKARVDRRTSTWVTRKYLNLSGT